MTRKADAGRRMQREIDAAIAASAKVAKQQSEHRPDSDGQSSDWPKQTPDRVEDLQRGKQ